MPPTTRLGVLHHEGPHLQARLLGSARAVDGVTTSPEQCEKWFAERRAAQVHKVTRIPFAQPGD